jgi:hypothetical protein
MRHSCNNSVHKIALPEDYNFVTETMESVKVPPNRLVLVTTDEKCPAPVNPERALRRGRASLAAVNWMALGARGFGPPTPAQQARKHFRISLLRPLERQFLFLGFLLEQVLFSGVDDFPRNICQQIVNALVFLYLKNPRVLLPMLVYGVDSP